MTHQCICSILSKFKMANKNWIPFTACCSKYKETSLVTCGQTVLKLWGKIVVFHISWPLVGAVLKLCRYSQVLVVITHQIWSQYAKVLRINSLKFVLICSLRSFVALFENGLTNQLEFHTFFSLWSKNDLIYFLWKSEQQSRRSLKMF